MQPWLSDESQNLAITVGYIAPPHANIKDKAVIPLSSLKDNIKDQAVIPLSSLQD